MDIGTLGGLGLGLVLILGSIVMGGSAGAFIDIPSMCVTLGGTIAGIFITYPMDKVKAVIAVTKKTLNAGNLDVAPWFKVVIEMATIARRDGVLALEEKIGIIEDEFLQRGLQMMVDGNPPRCC